MIALIAKLDVAHFQCNSLCWLQTQFSKVLPTTSGDGSKVLH